MKKSLVKFAALLMAVVLITASLMPVTNVEAATTYTKQKSVTLTINSGSYKSLRFIVKSNKNYSNQYKVKVQILSVTGKASSKTIDCWGYYGTNSEKGSFFYNLKRSKLKKGKTLVSDDCVCSSGGMTFECPDGISKIKIKVTLYSVSGKKQVKSLKKTNNYY